jgi:hypothetical protein
MTISKCDAIGYRTSSMCTAHYKSAEFRARRASIHVECDAAIYDKMSWHVRKTR